MQGNCRRSQGVSLSNGHIMFVVLLPLLLLLSTTDTDDDGDDDLLAMLANAGTNTSFSLLLLLLLLLLLMPALLLSLRWSLLASVRSIWLPPLAVSLFLMPVNTNMTINAIAERIFTTMHCRCCIMFASESLGTFSWPSKQMSLDWIRCFVLIEKSYYRCSTTKYRYIQLQWTGRLENLNLVECNQLWK